MWCNYCKNITHQKDGVKGECSVTNTVKYSTQVSCKDFKAGETFWCRSMFCIEYVNNCMHIRRSIKGGDPLYQGFEYSDCKKCTQYKEVKEVYDIINYKPPVLVKRQQNDSNKSNAEQKTTLVLKKRKPSLIKRKEK